MAGLAKESVRLRPAPVSHRWQCEEDAVRQCARSLAGRGALALRFVIWGSDLGPTPVGPNPGLTRRRERDYSGPDFQGPQMATVAARSCFSGPTGICTRLRYGCVVR